MSQQNLKVITIESDKDGKVLVPDEDGYYEVNGGALGVENTSGIFYKITPKVLSLFEDPKTFLVKKIQAKELYGELDHPEQLPVCSAVRQTKDTKLAEKRKWMMRQAKFDKDNISHHIKSIRLVETNIIDVKSGTKKILLKLKVKPFGVQKQILEDSFKNKNISTAFSIRALAIEELNPATGRVERELVMVFTFDFVGSPGIAGSNDQSTLVTEMSTDHLDELKTYAKEFRGESNESCALDMDKMISDIKQNSQTSKLMNQWI